MSSSQTTHRPKLRPTTPLVVAILLAVAPLLLHAPTELNMLIRLCIWTILLTGLNFITGLGRLTSLAQAGLYGLGAYAAAIAAVRLGVPTVLTLIIAPALTGLTAFIIGLGTLRLRAFYFKMATLAIGYVLYLVFGRATELTGGPSGFPGIPPLTLFSWDVSTPLSKYIVFATLTVAGLVVARNVERSRQGQALRALGVSEPAAVAAGVRPMRVKTFAFVLSAVYAGLAGALEAYHTMFISPSTFDFFAAVLLVVGLYVGGAGSATGPVIGAVLLTVVEELGFAYADYEPIIMGVVFLVALQLFPAGVAGLMRIWIQHFATRWRRDHGPRRPYDAHTNSPPGAGVDTRTSARQEQA